MLLHDHSDLAKVVAHAHRAPLQSYHQDWKCRISKRRSKVRFCMIKKGLMRRLIFARNVERYTYVHMSNFATPYIAPWQRSVGCGVKPVGMITHFS